MHVLPGRLGWLWGITCRRQLRCHRRSVSDLGLFALQRAHARTFWRSSGRRLAVWRSFEKSSGWSRAFRCWGWLCCCPCPVLMLDLFGDVLVDALLVCCESRLALIRLLHLLGQHFPARMRVGAAVACLAVLPDVSALRAVLIEVLVLLEVGHVDPQTPGCGRLGLLGCRSLDRRRHVELLSRGSRLITLLAWSGANLGKCVGSPPFGLRTPCDGARCHEAVVVGHDVGVRHAVVAQEYSFGS